IYNKYSAADLTDDTVFEELKQYIDTENYLQYYAIEVYLANRDWPYNNLKAYRYVSDDGDYTQNSVFDGRYRYLLYDVDTTMGLGSVRDTLDEAQSFNTLMILQENNYAPLFTALIEREDCRKYFVSYICDLMNGAFSPENVSAVLDEMHLLRDNEMQEYIEESERNPDLPDIGEPYLKMQMDCIKAWAETTADNLLSGLQELWELGDAYSLHVTLQEGDGIKINSCEVIEPEFIGTYLTGCNTVLVPVVQEGRGFSYWQINGEIYTEEEIMINAGMLIDGEVFIELYTDDVDEGLVLSEIKAKGEEDYIILTNITKNEINTRGYYLMDKDVISHVNYLKETVIAPGESILVGCEKYDKDDSFMNVNFNLKKGEEVMLGYSGSGIEERVLIPDLSLEDGVYRKNMTTGIWQEEREY
ncbi:MAG: hypothetical protein GX235_06050, partial [Clostridiales bacterium]|nr:hypothetical protein [Clostridiales bacterium]